LSFVVVVVVVVVVAVVVVVVVVVVGRLRRACDNCLGVIYASDGTGK